MGDSSGAGTAYHSQAPEFTPVFFTGVCVPQSFVFCILFCRPLCFIGNFSIVYSSIYGF